jgi:type IV pilus assembly protein PilA
MKKLNKKGFTLIELLAVIVVLAILMLVAVQNIFPMIANTRANSFISTVENIRDAANNKYISDKLTEISKGEKCYTVAHLVAKSYVSVDKDNIFGAVCVEESDTGHSEYKVFIYDKANGYLYSTGLNGDTANGGAADGTKENGTNGKGTIENSASIDSNVKKYFFDVDQNKNLSSIFTADGMKDPSNTGNNYAPGSTGISIPCYAKKVTGSAPITAVNYASCFNGKLSHHENV